MPLSFDHSSWFEETEDKSTAVELDLSVIDRLAAEVMRGFGAVPRRGVEVGGLLLGRATGGRIHVSEFESLACDYSFGPTYVLNGGDRERFREAMHRKRAGIDVVGVFRSHIGDELQPTAADAELLRDEGHTRPLLMLVKPAALAASSAALYLHRNNETKPVGRPFPLRVRDLAGTGALEREHRRRGYETKPLVTGPSGAAAAPAMKRELPEIPPPAFLDVPETERSQVGRILAWSVFFCALFALGAALGWYLGATQSPPVKAAAEENPFRVKLSAEQSGEGVLVRWDRSARAIRQSSRGVLTIREGADSQTVQLDTRQLRNGNVLYRHVPAEVSFELEVFVDGSRVAEGIVWRGGGGAAPAR